MVKTMRLEITRSEIYFTADILMRFVRDSVISKKQNWYLPESISVLTKIKILLEQNIDPDKTEYRVAINRINQQLQMLKKLN